MNSNTDNKILFSKRNGNKCLGIVDKRYVRKFHGIVHGFGSTIALLLGNFVFINRVLLGHQASGSSSTYRIFHACNFIASLTTALFFWNKVQSWQLSTTTMEEKGLTKQVIQRFNQGRGVVAMLMYSLVPFACSSVPHSYLESRIFSGGLALIMVASSVYCYYLIREYGAHLWVVYGMTPMALAIGILFHSEQRLSSFCETYPLAMDRFHKESSFVISCVQFGFMMYYLYSRNVVTKQTVKKNCKFYHTTVGIIFLLRLVHDLLTYFIEIGGSSITGSVIPWPMLIQPMVVSVAFCRKILSVLNNDNNNDDSNDKREKKVTKKPYTAATTTNERIFSIEQIKLSNESLAPAPPRRRSSMRRGGSLLARAA